MFEYVSTRGVAPPLGFADVTLAGLAADGGLYVPRAFPRISAEELANMAHQSYLEIAWRVILPFVSDDISSEELVGILRAAYKGFDHKDIVPLRQMDEGLHVLELFHGPTLAFKDVALQFLGQVFTRLLLKRDRRVTIIGATSGDTGSAAIEAFRGRENVDIFILHPKGRVSDVQRRQMTTVLEKNVFNIAVEGSFDDCQDLVKAMFNDAGFRADLNLSAINSINWARILAQVVYYIYAGTWVQAKTGRPATFAVPTGNFGNVYAGYVAQSMGLPVEKFLVATNRNDILHRFLMTGRMQAKGVTPSLSPSMDIQISSNFERLLFDLLGQQGDKVAAIMRHFRESGPFDLDDETMARLRTLFASGSLDDAETLAVIRHVYQRHDYIVDPHTAVGIGVAESWRKAHPEAEVIALATAHPAKFPVAVQKAIGVVPELPPQLADLHTREERCVTLANDLGSVQEFIRQNAGAGI